MPDIDRRLRNEGTSLYYVVDTLQRKSLWMHGIQLGREWSRTAT